MQIIKGDIWKKWEEGHYIGVTTNCERNNKGEAIMGAGIAKEAKRRIPTLPKDLGHFLEIDTPILFNKYKIITVPTKYEWRKPSSLALIKTSCKHLQTLMLVLQKEIYLPQLGCSNGQLKWEDVKPIMEKYLTDDRFIVVEYSAVQ